MIMRLIFNRLRRDTSGVTAVEFGLVAPTFFMVLLGIFDLGYTVYARAILDGAVQKAARDATLETATASLTAIDNRVEELVGPLGANATFNFERKNYVDFSNVNTAEEYDDTNGNGQRDTGECYTDANSNGNWDSDMGEDGVGGARDVVLYTVEMSFPRKFPLWKMLGEEQDATITTSTVLRNQPYGDQQSAGTSVLCN